MLTLGNSAWNWWAGGLTVSVDSGGSVVPAWYHQCQCGLDPASVSGQWCPQCPVPLTCHQPHSAHSVTGHTMLGVTHTATLSTATLGTAHHPLIWLQSSYQCHHSYPSATVSWIHHCDVIKLSSFIITLLVTSHIWDISWGWKVHLLNTKS